MNFIYALGLVVLILLIYLNLKREKRKAEKEFNPMNEARIINSYILIVVLTICVLYFIFK